MTNTKLPPSVKWINPERLFLDHFDESDLKAIEDDGRERREAKIALITKACNAHYELVEALKHCHNVISNTHTLECIDLFRFTKTAEIIERTLKKAGAL